jgi:hypothetical protein
MEAKFADVLEAADELKTDEKEMLVDILQHRLVEDRRKEIKANIEETREAFKEGLLKPSTIDDIMGEILS